jgi:hypothetical protein
MIIQVDMICDEVDSRAGEGIEGDGCTIEYVLNISGGDVNANLFGMV